MVLLAAVVWVGQDQLQRVLQPTASLSMLAIVLVIFAGWAAWRARGSLSAALLGAVALSLGLQVGRFLSDFMSGVDWFTPDYWRFWSSGFGVLLAVNATLILVLAFPIRWVESRWRDA